MNWIAWLTSVPLGAVVLSWLACVCTERWFAAWVLLYVMRGLAVAAGALYAVAGYPGALLPFGLLYLLLWGAHWLFPASGPRQIGPRSRKARAAPRRDPGFWQFWTVNAWRMNPVLAVLLWAAWGMILAGLGLVLAVVA